MVKENFRLFLRVINVTIIGKKEILKMLHDYIFPVINYDSIKNQYNADGFKHLVYFVTWFLFNVSIKDAMIYLNSMQFTFMAISRTPSRRYP